MCPLYYIAVHIAVSMISIIWFGADQHIRLDDIGTIISPQMEIVVGGSNLDEVPSSE